MNLCTKPCFFSVLRDKNCLWNIRETCFTTTIKIH